MRIVALADLHGHYPNDVPDCDVVVVAGDVVLFNPDMSSLTQAQDLRRQLTLFRGWLNELNMRGIIVVGVAGNHDFPFAEVPGLTGKFNWHYLEDSGWEWKGVKFYGTPWQPWLGGWAFNGPEEDLGSDADLEEEPWLEKKFSQIPAETDVLIAHTPPAGFGDKVKGVHRGSFALSRAIERVKPKLFICGHIHKPEVEVIEGVVMCNASYVGWNRRPNGHPIQMFDV